MQGALCIYQQKPDRPEQCYNIRIIITGGRAISSIIIDGYNLIGTQHRDLQKEREAVIRQLIAYRKLKGHDITIVFDGWKAGSSHQEQTVIGGVTVIYSRLGDKADKVIKNMIEQHRKEWIVITSDREIMDHAWKNSSVPVPSDKFMSRLEQTGDEYTGGFELLDEDDNERKPRGTHPYTPPGRGIKGSSRQPSKKEKALMRALKKL